MIVIPGGYIIGIVYILYIMDRQKDLIFIGSQIRQLRQKKGYSQEDFANFIEMNRGYYGTIERGEANFTILNLLKIVKGLEPLPEGFLSAIFCKKKFSTMQEA